MTINKKTNTYFLIISVIITGLLGFYSSHCFLWFGGWSSYCELFPAQFIFFGSLLFLLTLFLELISIISFMFRGEKENIITHNLLLMTIFIPVIFYIVFLIYNLIQL